MLCQILYLLSTRLGFALAQTAGSNMVPLGGSQVAIICPNGQYMQFLSVNGKNTMYCDTVNTNDYGPFNMLNKYNVDSGGAGSAQALTDGGTYFMNVQRHSATEFITATPWQRGNDLGNYTLVTSDYGGPDGTGFHNYECALNFYIQPDGSYKIQAIANNGDYSTSSMPISGGRDAGYWQVQADSTISTPNTVGPASADKFRIVLAPSSSIQQSFSTIDNLDSNSYFYIQNGPTGNFWSFSEGRYVHTATTRDDAATFRIANSTIHPGLNGLFDVTNQQFVSIPSNSSALTGAPKQISRQTELLIVPLGDRQYAIWTQTNPGAYVIASNGNFYPTGSSPEVNTFVANDDYLAITETTTFTPRPTFTSPTATNSYVETSSLTMANEFTRLAFSSSTASPFSSTLAFRSDASSASAPVKVISATVSSSWESSSFLSLSSASGEDAFVPKETFGGSSASTSIVSSYSFVATMISASSVVDSTSTTTISSLSLSSTSSAIALSSNGWSSQGSITASATTLSLDEGFSLQAGQRSRTVFEAPSVSTTIASTSIASTSIASTPTASTPITTMYPTSESIIPSRSTIELDGPTTISSAKIDRGYNSTMSSTFVSSSASRTETSTEKLNVSSAKPSETSRVSPSKTDSMTMTSIISSSSSSRGADLDGEARTQSISHGISSVMNSSATTAGPTAQKHGTSSSDKSVRGSTTADAQNVVTSSSLSTRTDAVAIRPSSTTVLSRSTMATTETVSSSTRMVPATTTAKIATTTTQATNIAPSSSASASTSDDDSTSGETEGSSSTLGVSIYGVLAIAAACALF